MKKLCVYLHRRLDTNNIFYVGIGSLRRANSKHSRNVIWKNIVKKHGFSVEITHQDLIREEACVIEKYLINFYNSINNSLCNVTQGGDGASTEMAIKMNEKRWSRPEEREKLSEKNRKRFESVEERQNISNANYKRFESAEERQKISTANRKRFESVEEREKMRNYQKSFWANLSKERREEIIAKMRKPKKIKQ